MLPYAFIYSLPVTHSLFGTTHQWQLNCAGRDLQINSTASLVLFFNCKLSVRGAPVPPRGSLVRLYEDSAILFFFFFFPSTFFETKKEKGEGKRSGGASGLRAPQGVNKFQALLVRRMYVDYGRLRIK